MAGKKADFKQCPHCGRKIKTDANPDGFRYRVTNENMNHSISCPCGVTTKLCPFKANLQVIWNSRPGKPFVIPMLQVTHAATRGAQEGDTQLGAGGEKQL